MMEAWICELLVWMKRLVSRWEINHRMEVWLQDILRQKMVVIDGDCRSARKWIRMRDGNWRRANRRVRVGIKRRLNGSSGH